MRPPPQASERLPTEEMRGAIVGAVREWCRGAAPCGALALVITRVGVGT